MVNLGDKFILFVNWNLGHGFPRELGYTSLVKRNHLYATWSHFHYQITLKSLTEISLVLG
jgi:hypothetical protein